MKILVTDKLSEQGLDLLRQEEDFEVVVKTGLSEEELIKEIRDADAILVRSGTKVTAKIIDSAENLKVIGRAGVGVDNIDLDAATKRGIIVMNTPGGNTISAAEHTMGLLLAMVRNIPQAYISMREGKWERKRFQGVELFGKTLGIIGLGRIGTEVAKRALAFGMKVIAYDPFLSQERAEKLDITPVDLDEIFSRSDIITVHTPLTPETKGLINRENILKMKDGVMILNCARGGIVDEGALADALRSGKVKAAGLDVYEKEPPEGSPLISLDNVILTPHLGASTREAQENVAGDIAKQVIDYLKNGIVRNAVNIPSVDVEVLRQLEPYMYLGTKLGSISAQLITGQLEEVQIRYCGSLSELNVIPVTLSVLKGLLGYALQEGVNIVNAPVIARERGIKVIESKTSAAEDFADVIYVTVSTGGKNTMKFSVAGTVFGHKKDPRIVRINEYHMDAVPSGYILYLVNRDIPGIIGYVGTVLGRNNINIAGMSLGRNVPGGLAVTMLNIDDRISDEVMDELKRNPDIVDVRMLIL